MTIEQADAADCYGHWPAPTAIVSDGPYGLGGYPGDPRDPSVLADFYRPHAKAWAAASLPSTTLWFWCTEIGWALSHPALAEAGWVYKTCHVWDNGSAHISGNVNGQTIRSFPVVTEVCVQYVREARLPGPDGDELAIKEWLRAEWRRAGLTLTRLNEAAGVRNAATRKWFTQCHLWYPPPGEALVQIADYATRHGRPDGGRPYFSLDGVHPLTADAWELMRAKWHHVHGIHNVWRVPPVRNGERVKSAGAKPLHACQKPLSLMELSIAASTDPGDVVWEPFAGLASASVAAARLGRIAYAAERNPVYWEAARDRARRDASS